jgi:hypothetical protein
LGSISRSSLASWAASVLFGAITRVGRCSFSISQPVVAGLAGAGGAEQHHVLLAAGDALLQLRDRGRLVAGRPVLADHLEVAAGAGDLPHRSELEMGNRHLEAVPRCPGPLSRMPRPPGYEPRPTVSRAVCHHRPMHPPKRATFDVPAMVNVDSKASPGSWTSTGQTAFGLYMSREMVARSPRTGWSRGCCPTSGCA